MEANDFINRYGQVFRNAVKGTPIFASVKLAQAALETGWGKNFVNGANNMFGIKATGQPNKYWKGDKQLATTKEDFGNGKTSVNDYFRKYASVEDSINDHSLLLLTLPRYEAVRTASTPEEQCKALQICGYATAKDYASTLIKIIQQYNLKRFD